MCVSFLSISLVSCRVVLESEGGDGLGDGWEMPMLHFTSELQLIKKKTMIELTFDDLV